MASIFGGSAYRQGSGGLLKGVKELDAQLAELGSRLGGNALRTAVRDAVKPVFRRAQETIPVGTRAHRLTATYGKRLVAPGFGKRSLRIKTGFAQGGKGAFATVGVRDEAFYVVAGFEYGYRGIPRNPWLRHAFNATQKEQLAIFSASLKKRIRDAIRKRARAAGGSR